MRRDCGLSLHLTPPVPSLPSTNSFIDLMYSTPDRTRNPQYLTISSGGRICFYDKTELQLIFIKGDDLARGDREERESKVKKK
ncbi:hypothetical protein BVC80_8849g19 [Macleaya cordata]|uniref:Uncharacterized protein n=1 Tax=Macleaya cordata TaxID=56857 RepID=A0A200RDX0_MACCD|nr:hypothetical protein BVC80_8849g19 [Macleaya cordata]